jgi:hypothetical protein
MAQAITEFGEVALEIRQIEHGSSPALPRPYQWTLHLASPPAAVGQRLTASQRA